MTASFLRRLAIVVIALSVSALLLRGSISSALVTRGDDLEASRNAPRAMQKYGLALWIDGSNVVAIDRFAFDAIRSHNKGALAAAIRAIDSSSAPSDALMSDRALCFHLLGRYRLAADGFERVGRDAHDARALLFAALDLIRVHQRSRARALLVQAVAYEPGFVPARAALQRSSSW